MTPPYRPHHAPNSALLIVRLALVQSTDYEVFLVVPMDREHEGANCLQLNPIGLILTLKTADWPVSETGAILLFLVAEGPSELGLYNGFLMRWSAFSPIGETNDRSGLENCPHPHHLAGSLDKRTSTIMVRRAEAPDIAPFTTPKRADPPEGTAT